ncbi:MAG: stage III sporulation protein AB [Clostridia bacterium]
MKIILFIVIIASCGYVGIATSKQYTQKKLLYSDLIKVCSRFSVSVRYTKPIITDIIQGLIGSCSEPMKETFENFTNCLRFPEMPAPKHYCALVSLSEEERKEIDDFLCGLGKSDTSGQTEHIALYAERFDMRYKEALQICKNKGTMCSKLGILAGIMLCIVLM